MGNQPDQPWNPYDLFTDEHNAILESSNQIEAAQAHVRELAHSLAADGLLALPDVQWLIHMAYCALADVKDHAWQVEYEARVRQLASQSCNLLEPAQPAEVIPFEVYELPEWLRALDTEGGAR